MNIPIRPALPLCLIAKRKFSNDGFEEKTSIDSEPPTYCQFTRRAGVQTVIGKSSKLTTAVNLAFRNLQAGFIPKSLNHNRIT